MIIKRIETYIRQGFSEVHLVSASPDEKKFIRIFGEKVIPYLKSTYGDV